MMMALKIIGGGTLGLIVIARAQILVERLKHTYYVDELYNASAQDMRHRIAVVLNKPREGMEQTRWRIAMTQASRRMGHYETKLQKFHRRGLMVRIFEDYDAHDMHKLYDHVIDGTSDAAMYGYKIAGVQPLSSSEIHQELYKFHHQ